MIGFSVVLAKSLDLDRWLIADHVGGDVDELTTLFSVNGEFSEHDS